MHLLMSNMCVDMCHLVWISNLVHCLKYHTKNMSFDRHESIHFANDGHTHNCVNFDVRSTNLQKSFISFYVLYFILRNNPIFKVSICAESAFFSFLSPRLENLMMVSFPLHFIYIMSRISSIMSRI